MDYWNEISYVIDNNDKGSESEAKQGTEFY